MSWGFDVDVGFLSGTARELRDSVSLAVEMEDRAGELHGYTAAAGLPPVQKAAEAFLWFWGDGVKLIREDAGGMADAVAACAEIYAEVDDAVAASTQAVGRGLVAGVDAVNNAAGEAAQAVGDAVEGVADTIRGVLG